MSGRWGETMTCPNCQKQIADGSKFCYNCGAKQAETGPTYAAPAYAPPKRLVRSINDRKLAGVCAGLADYFDMDPTIIRVLWMLATLVPGPNIIAYIILWIAVPEGQTAVHTTSAAA
ncbi:MAG TPA: PspC domain-containing protein [Candidatus Udaeobacter sp.]|nr:PspC domain-containing protein [Candidatus Udaeobacter sp.]